MSSISTTTNEKPKPKPKPWVHFVAGGIGGTVGAVVTCPLDVVKTRLQSDVYHSMYNKILNREIL